MKVNNIYDELIIVHANLSGAYSKHETLLKDPTTTSLQQERKVKKVGVTNYNPLDVNTKNFDAHLNEITIGDK